jgi:hypothetical protein
MARCHIGGSRDSGWDSESLLVSRALAELQSDLRKAAARSQVCYRRAATFTQVLRTRSGYLLKELNQS